MIFCKVFHNFYRDSVFLMKIANDIQKNNNIKDALLIMGSKANKQSLKESGFYISEMEEAGPNDLIIAVKAESSSAGKTALNEAIELVKKQREKRTDLKKYFPTLRDAVAEHPNSKLALVSIPGQYAAAITSEALDDGLHVFLFSDNVSVEEEIDLKKEGKKKGLLVMGPDCGTAIIDGIPVAFANAVKRGEIGIVGASGTGIQEVTTLLDRLGLGISQAIGVGGRDLSEKVGGLTMLQGIDLLEKDPGTKIMVLISKPPSEKVANKILERLSVLRKPCVVCFLGYTHGKNNKTVKFCSLLEKVIPEVLKFYLEDSNSGDYDFWMSEEDVAKTLKQEKERLSTTQKLLKGFFSGGTLSDEAKIVLDRLIGPVLSNVWSDETNKKNKEDTLDKHVIIDLGDDEFTKGRPHPMIDPALRNEFIEKEFSNPTTGVILFDVVLGYGSTTNPVEELIEIIYKKRKKGEKDNDVSMICSVCGVDKDPQNRQSIVEQLRKSGVVVMPSNAQASLLAGLVISSKNSLSDYRFGPAPLFQRNTATKPSVILGEKPSIINIGIEGFYKDLYSFGADTCHVDWKPSAGGDKDLSDILSKIL